ncbi:MAG TPA: mechanosensitive ion channel domain-containing protein [Magnetospirillaceae bacterium]|jgi:small-conductance mechanosensitive channel
MDTGLATANTGFATAIDLVKDALFWLPSWASAAIVIAIVCAIFLYLHTLALRLVRRSSAGKRRFVSLLLMRGANPTRFAIFLLALGIALPISGFSKDFQDAMIAPLTAVFILVIGWSCIAAVGLAGDLYLDRFTGGYADALTRKHVTQVRLLRKAGQVLIVLIAVGVAMMSIPAIRQYGVSLFASAGAAGIVVGLAARPLLSNLLAGIQIAITQPVKIEDSVVINGEWGWIEDITSTYLVVRCWDLRRLIVPLSWFLEQPIQNWTRESATIIGTILLYVDYRTPIEELRRETERIVHASKLWDGNVVNLQVVDVTTNAMQIRVLATASDASRVWDLRCEVREKLLEFLQTRHPDCLPLHRIDVTPFQPAPEERQQARRQPAA